MDNATPNYDTNRCVCLKHNPMSQVSLTKSDTLRRVVQIFREKNSMNQYVRSIRVLVKQAPYMCFV